MKINLGSTNPVKVQAVKEIINANIISLSVDSGVSDQPRSFEEALKGAKNRAVNAFRGCDYSVGIEDGLIDVDEKMMCCTICVLYDGKEFHYAKSTGFQIPDKVAEIIKKEKCNLTEAALKSGLTDNENVGREIGVIGLLTNGKLTRKDYIKEGLRNLVVFLQ